MMAEIDAAKTDGDTLGGVVEVSPTACRSGSALHYRPTAASTSGWRGR